MYTLTYRDANGDNHSWLCRTEELALAMKRRIAARWYHAWAEDVSESCEEETFIHTAEFEAALENWESFSNNEEYFNVERAQVINCKTALELVDIPD